MKRIKIEVEPEIHSWVKGFSKEHPQYGGPGDVIDMLVNFFIHQGGIEKVRRCQEAV